MGPTVTKTFSALDACRLAGLGCSRVHGPGDSLIWKLIFISLFCQFLEKSISFSGFTLSATQYRCPRAHAQHAD